MARSRLFFWATLLGILFSLQLGWWGIFLMSQTTALGKARLELLAARRDAAESAWRGALEETLDPAAAWSAVAPAFPGIEFLPGESGGSVEISREAAREVEGLASRQHRMVLAEGSLFVLLAGLGIWFALRTAKREAYRVLQQSNFLHAVTHEFRSPIQSIRLALESLLRRPDPERARRYTQGMLEDLARLEGLVENLLSVGRLEAEAFHASPRPIDLSEALRQEVDRYEKFHPDLDPPLQVSLDSGVQAEADPGTLAPILSNLLENAVKYGEGKPVRVALETEGAYALLTVSDQGRGFSSEEHSHLFERFWRAGEDRVRKHTGVGLGLYLVARLVRAQGASLEARSPGPGHGAVFSVRWPLVVKET